MHAVRLIPIAVSLTMIGLGAQPAATMLSALSGSAPESIVRSPLVRWSVGPLVRTRRPSGLAAQRTGGPAAQRIEDFQLPPKTVFDRAMPRYPNVWFHVDTALAPSHREAVKLVTDALRDSMRLREFFPPFDNPEGCDFEARIEHLQPWEDRTARALQHAHAFHMRYYYSALAANRLEQVTLNTEGSKRRFYRFGASVHYEVEHSNPNHADVEACPICGRTGEYANRAGNLVELVHDPLGLELLLSGTIRGERVRFEDYGQREVGSIAALGDRFKVSSLIFPGLSGDRNTLRVGAIIITDRR